jgi:hypothetical protein
VDRYNQSLMKNWRKIFKSSFSKCLGKLDRYNHI